MRHIFFLFFLILTTLSFSNTHAESTGRFFSLLNDVPLIEGVYELEDEAITFDKPEGRIVHLTAVSDMQDRDTIQKQYNKILPQLGWSQNTTNQFTKNGEILSLSFDDNDGLVFIHMNVEPALK